VTVYYLLADHFGKLSMFSWIRARTKPNGSGDHAAYYRDVAPEPGRASFRQRS
jgi:hypothetical protein